MKTLILVFALLCTSSFAFAAETTQCTLAQFQILDRAEGVDSGLVDQYIHLESPNFKCTVKPVYKMFPQDCGRFTFVELHYKVTVVGNVLKALVHNGSISCTAMKKVELVKAELTR